MTSPRRYFTPPLGVWHHNAYLNRRVIAIASAGIACAEEPYRCVFLGAEIPPDVTCDTVQCKTALWLDEEGYAQYGLDRLTRGCT